VALTSKSKAGLGGPYGTFRQNCTISQNNAGGGESDKAVID